jgi:hypothetical protein
VGGPVEEKGKGRGRGRREGGEEREVHMIEKVKVHTPVRMLRSFKLVHAHFALAKEHQAPVFGTLTRQPVFAATYLAYFCQVSCSDFESTILQDLVA